MHDLPWDLGVQSRNQQTVTQNVNSEKSFPFVSELQLLASCKLVALVIHSDSTRRPFDALVSLVSCGRSTAVGHDVILLRDWRPGEQLASIEEEWKQCHLSQVPGDGCTESSRF